MNMIKSLKYIAIFATALFLLAACEENATQSEASLVSFDEITSSSGFLWFSEKYIEYEPNEEYVNQIAAGFNPATDSIFVFAKPSCTCNGNHYYFASFMKIADMAGIDHSNMTFVSINSKNDIHPFQDRMHLTMIPEFIIIRDGQWQFHPMDELFFSNSYNDEATLEQVMADALNIINQE